MPSAAHALDSSATAVGVGDASSRRGSNSDGAAAIVKKSGVEKKIEQDGDTFSTPYTTLEAALHGSRLHGEDTLPATSSDEEGEDEEKQERTKRYNMKRTTTTITTASVPSAPPLSPIAATSSPAPSLWSAAAAAAGAAGLFGLPPATTFDFGAAVDGALLFPPTPIDFAAHTGVGAASTVTETSLFGASTTSAQALTKAGTSLVYTSSTSGGLFDTAMPVWPTTTTATSAGLVGTAAGLFAEGGGRVGEGLFGLPPATAFGAMSQSPPPLPPLPPPPPSAYSLWLLDGVAGGVSAHRFHL